MRAAPLLIAVMLLGCKAEPSFDERFKARQKELEGRAQSIDREIDAAQSDAVPEDAAAARVEPSTPGAGSSREPHEKSGKS